VRARTSTQASVIRVFMRSPASLFALLVLSLLGCNAEVPSAGNPAPTPEATAVPADVCRHVREVASKDQTAPNLLDEREAARVAALERVRTQDDTLTSCLLAANVAADITACEKPMRSWTNLLVTTAPKFNDVEICEHVVEVTKREFGDSPRTPTEEEL